MPPIASTTLIATRPATATSGDPLRMSTAWQSATVVRISAGGEVDASNSERLSRYVFRYAANCRHLILDLSGVEFFAVEAFSTLRTIGHRCATAQVNWTLVPGRAVSRVLTLCDPRGALLSDALIAS